MYTCFTSDFLLEDADSWRPQAWDMIRARQDLRFFFVTKRIARFRDCLPFDWGDGWEHVHICCTVENQQQAAFRLPIFLQAPIRHKSIICEPLLGEIDLTPWLCPQIESVSVGGSRGRTPGCAGMNGCSPLPASARKRALPSGFARPAHGL